MHSTYDGFLNTIQNAHKYNISEFQKFLSGRHITCTLYSINRNSKQSEFGKIKRDSSYQITKVLNYPLFNVQTSEKSVSFDFDNGGYRTSDGVKTSATVLSDVYQVENDDKIILTGYDENIVYRVDVEENNLYDNNKSNIKTINLVSTDKKLEQLELQTELTLHYNFEINNLMENNLRDKLIQHFSKNLSETWLKKYRGLISDKCIGNRYDFKLFDILYNKYEVCLNTYVTSLDASIPFPAHEIEEINLEEMSLTEINNIYNSIDFDETNFDIFLYYLQDLKKYGQVHLNRFTKMLELKV